MKNVPRDIQHPSPFEYAKPEENAIDNGLLSTSDNPAGDALAQSLQSRREKLATKKIGLNVDPQDVSEQ